VTRNFPTIDGRTPKRDVGEVVMEYVGDRATRIVVFAEPADAHVPGVDASEGLGLEIELATRNHRKAEGVLAL